MSNHHSLVIIGAGPAGLSAAVNAKILNVDVLLVGDLYGSLKTRLAPQILNYLGFGKVKGDDLNERFCSHATEIGVNFSEKKVFGVYKSGNGFSLDVGGEFLTADCVILATGVSSVAQIEGEKEFLGRGVSYCATCDAPLIKGKNAVVVGYDEESVKEANYIATICSSVTFIPMKKLTTPLSDDVKVVNATPLSFADPENTGKATVLKTKEGDYTGDGFFVLKPLSADNLVYGLKTVNGLVETDKNCKTNIDGLFAAGDVTGAPYKYQKATGEGQVAAFSAYDYLLKINPTETVQKTKVVPQKEGKKVRKNKNK